MATQRATLRGLQGLNKSGPAKYGGGAGQDLARSYDIPAAAPGKDRSALPGNDPQRALKDLQARRMPRLSALKDTVARLLPLWHETIAPMVKSGQKVIIAAHGNSLRALVKYLDKIPESEIVELNIQPASRWCDELDANLKPIQALLPRGSGSHRGSDEGRGQPG